MRLRIDDARVTMCKVVVPRGFASMPARWIDSGNHWVFDAPTGGPQRVVEGTPLAARLAHLPFRSVAQTFGRNALAVVLTGMGQDGLRGCEAIRAAGGQVIVQDEPTSVVWGMPGFVARAGLANRVLPLGLIAPDITRRVQLARGKGR